MGRRGLVVVSVLLLVLVLVPAGWAQDKALEDGLEPPAVVTGTSVEDDGDIFKANLLRFVGPGNIFEVAAVIGDGPFGLSSGDYDFYAVEVNAGQTLIIDVDRPFVVGVDSYVWLYNSGGALLAENDDSWTSSNGSGGSSGSHLEWHNPSESRRTAYVAVGGFGSGPLGDPFDSSTGPGAGDMGSYVLRIGNQVLFHGPEAAVTVNNDNAVTGPRDLFELINNGAARFVFTDTDTGNRWQFSQNQNGNFSVSRLGSVGPDTGNLGAELLIAKSGRVKMGPGGDTTFDLLANGNLTITGALTENSDVYAKTSISGVDAQAVLEAVVELPIAEWSYLDDAGVRHLGPMAQDFYAAFGLGADETGIASLDTSGVALASIQALADQNQVLAGQNQSLETKVRWMMWLMGTLMLGWGVSAVGRRRTRNLARLDSRTRVADLAF